MQRNEYNINTENANENTSLIKNFIDFSTQLIESNAIGAAIGGISGFSLSYYALSFYIDITYAAIAGDAFTVAANGAFLGTCSGIGVSVLCKNAGLFSENRRRDAYQEISDAGQEINHVSIDVKRLSASSH